MPIVFEEVTGEIGPERDAGPPETTDGEGGEPEDFGRRVRREMALACEREYRVRAD